MPDQPLDHICPNCGKPCGKCGIKNHRSACDWHKKYDKDGSFDKWVVAMKKWNKKKGLVW